MWNPNYSIIDHFWTVNVAGHRCELHYSLTQTEIAINDHIHRESRVCRAAIVAIVTRDAMSKYALVSNVRGALHCMRTPIFNYFECQPKLAFNLILMSCNIVLQTHTYKIFINSKRIPDRYQNANKLKLMIQVSRILIVGCVQVEWWLHASFWMSQTLGMLNALI